MGAISEDAILRCFSVVTRWTSPLRMVLGVHVLSRMFFCISYIGFLQSWPYASVAEFDVLNLALAFPGPTFVEPPLRRT